MVGVVLLAKATTRYSHNASLIDHVHAVHEVGWDMLLLSSSQSLVGKVDLREGIHGAFNIVAGSVIHVIESLRQQASSLLEPVVDASVLSLELLDASARLLTELRRIGHKISSHLSDGVRAELN